MMKNPRVSDVLIYFKVYSFLSPFVTWRMDILFNREGNVRHVVWILLACNLPSNEKAVDEIHKISLWQGSHIIIYGQSRGFDFRFVCWYFVSVPFNENPMVYFVVYFTWKKPCKIWYLFVNNIWTSKPLLSLCTSYYIIIYIYRYILYSLPSWTIL